MVLLGQEANLSLICLRTDMFHTVLRGQAWQLLLKFNLSHVCLLRVDHQGLAKLLQAVLGHNYMEVDPTPRSFQGQAWPARLEAKINHFYQLRVDLDHTPHQGLARKLLQAVM